MKVFQIKGKLIFGEELVFGILVLLLVASVTRFVWWVLLLSGSGPGTAVPDAVTWSLNRVAVMAYTIMLSLFAFRWTDAVHSSLSSSSSVPNALFKWIVGVICGIIIV